MSTQVPHDHPAVTTFEGSIVERGPTRRPAIECPPKANIEDGAVTRIVLDGSTYFSVPRRRESGSIRFLGAYETTGGARENTGENHLIKWVRDRGLTGGRTVYVDEVVTGYQYGLRGPGESARYDGSQPDDGLRDIAQDL